MTTQETKSVAKDQTPIIVFSLSSVVYLIFVSILLAIFLFDTRPWEYSYIPSWGKIIRVESGHHTSYQFEYEVDGKKYSGKIFDCSSCAARSEERIYYRKDRPEIYHNEDPGESIKSLLFTALIGLFVFPTLVSACAYLYCAFDKPK